MELVALALVFEHTRISLAEHCLVEALAEFPGGLGHLLVDFLVKLGDKVFNEHVGAVAFLGVAVVDQGVVEGVHVSGCLPDSGVHENRRVDAYDIVVEHRHRLPPVTLDVVLELYAVLAVVVDGGKAVVDLTRLEHEAVFLGMCHYGFEDIFLFCHCLNNFSNTT